jgi:hypothetical protein
MASDCEAYSLPQAAMAPDLRHRMKVTAQRIVRRSTWGEAPVMARFAVAACFVVATSGLIAAGQVQDPHQTMNQRGAHVMGFDQDKTTHHFYLYTDGGAVDVSVNDPKDKTNLDGIRQHLPHIAMMFGQGNFDAPMMVHDTKVPGTAELAKFKDRLTYKYTETAKGGRVDITTADAEALKAVHAFLKFQITDHKTGDSLDVKKR